MSFRRKDYHNSRSYEADPPTPGRGRLSLAVAWLKLQMDKMLRSGASSSISPVTLFPGNEGPYSLLGSDVQDLPPHKWGSTAFPMADREPGCQTRLQPARANGTRRTEHQPER